MNRGKTKTGFEFVIEDHRLDDYELVEALHKFDSGDAGYLTVVVSKLLGEEQEQKLKDHVKDVKGYISTTMMVEEVLEIFGICNSLKN